MKKKSKRLLIFGAIFIVVVVVILNITRSGKNLTPVQTEKVIATDLTEEVSASGWVQPETRVNITSQVTAEIIAIPVKEGQYVQKGDLLVLLDTVQLQKDVEQYEFSLNEMESRTEGARVLDKQSEDEYERQKKLFESDLTSQSVYDQAEYTYLNNKYTYEAMLSQTKQARARYEKAVDNLRRTRIVAPMNGNVTFLDAEVGEIAAAQTAFTQGKTLMTISNLKTFEVEVDVDETEIIKVDKGQKVKIEVDAYPDTVFNGEVVEVGNTAVVSGRGTTDQSTDFKVKVLFMDSNVNIKPGMSATVDIVTDEKHDVLTVPYGAIVMRSLDPDSLAKAMHEPKDGGAYAAESSSTEEGSSSRGESSIASAHAATVDSVDSSAAPEKKEKKEIKGVFVIKEGLAEFVPVETGIADQKQIEVTSGLEKGESVITGPYKTLRIIKQGEEVKITNKEKSGNPDAAY
jgi:HlyD family secretion protein